MYELDKDTLSLLHFDDGITDETGKVWTAVGTPTISEVQSRFGGKSLYLDGQDYKGISTPYTDDFNFLEGDFTVEWWEYRTALVNSSAAIVIGDGAYSFVLGSSTGSNCGAYASSDGTSYDMLNNFNMGVIETNVWTHRALVRKNDTIYSFKNGSLVLSGNFISGHKSIKISGNTDIPGSNATLGKFAGYIDEVRISKGIARWTSDFNPSTPINLVADAGDAKVTLSWTAAERATSYNVKRSTTAGGPYTTIASNVMDTIYIDTSVTNGTTYYYVITAVNDYGESANSNEASATPVSNRKSLLRITMNDSSEREYRLTSTEIDAFIKWYTRTVGTGTTCYTFNDTIDNSKEYLAFEKIISFKVIPTVE